mgnify:FL=1
MLDATLSQLRSYNDATLRATIEDDPEAMQRLVMQHFHCG